MSFKMVVWPLKDGFTTTLPVGESKVEFLSHICWLCHECGVIWIHHETHQQQQCPHLSLGGLLLQHTGHPLQFPHLQLDVHLGYCHQISLPGYGQRRNHHLTCPSVWEVEIHLRSSHLHWCWHHYHPPHPQGSNIFCIFLKLWVVSHFECFWQCPTGPSLIFGAHDHVIHLLTINCLVDSLNPALGPLQNW